MEKSKNDILLMGSLCFDGAFKRQKILISSGITDDYSLIYHFRGQENL
jgi:hypothetical protein